MHAVADHITGVVNSVGNLCPVRVAKGIAYVLGGGEGGQLYKILAEMSYPRQCALFSAIGKRILPFYTTKPYQLGLIVQAIRDLDKVETLGRLPAGMEMGLYVILVHVLGGRKEVWVRQVHEDGMGGVTRLGRATSAPIDCRDVAMVTTDAGAGGIGHNKVTFFTSDVFLAQSAFDGGEGSSAAGSFVLMSTGVGSLCQGRL
jgi:hypothetical protein